MWAWWRILQIFDNTIFLDQHKIDVCYVTADIGLDK